MIDRLEEFIKNQGISVRAFEQAISASDGMIRRAINNRTNIQSKWLCNIAENFPQLNLNWLITGQGEMLLSSSKANINTGGNNISGNIGSSVNTGIGNHMVNITMPESGTQKIIKPSGEVEIQRTDSTKSEGTKEAELCKEIELMKQRVALMEEHIKMKDDLIASLKDANAVLKDSIELLRNRR